MSWNHWSSDDRGQQPDRGDDGRDARGKNGDDDTVRLDVSADRHAEMDLGAGDDVVQVRGDKDSQVRLTFTSAEVGDGNANDSNTMMNQDGGLAVRVQAEDGLDGLTGPVSRFDDEGISFESNTRGLTFDVRDLVAGTQRGDRFDVVRLGTKEGDKFDESGERESYYINAGMGDDAVTGGNADDFLVGGAGNDTLEGGRGDDSLLGGGGNDTAVVDASRDDADTTDLGAGNDVVLVSAKQAGEIRLTFTSADVGNASATDGNNAANEDGGLAVRFQAEDGSGGLAGSVSRYDDEGITFAASTPGVTFDVRDLVAGTQRGNLFEVVRLGTEAGDSLDSVQADRPYYINAGMGDDTVTGGNANDFLVGGAGNDSIVGGTGNDSLLGGGGNDTQSGGEGNDTALFNVSTDGADATDLGAGDDVVLVSAAQPQQVRLTFTSADIGDAAATDGNNMANEDGGLAVRFQAEDGADDLAGPVSRYDDEGITFVSSTPGVTFDVRDLVAGTQRGDLFEVVRLGTEQGDNLNAVQADRPYYLNAGAGNDTVTGGNANDFLVGGAGSDTLISGAGNDSQIGGGGADTFTFDTALDDTANVDRILDFSTADDTIQLDDDVFVGLSEGALDMGAFALSSATGEDDDRIIYDQATGGLFFDADGGARDDMVAFATLTPPAPAAPPVIGASDFFIV